MNTIIKEKTKRILIKEIQMYFSKEFQYRGQLLAWIIADIIKIVGLGFIWVAAAEYNNYVEQSYVVSYYILLMFVSKFTADYTLEYGIWNILQGKFSNYLLKPYNYLIEYLGTNIGGNILRVILFLPAFGISLYLANTYNLLIFSFNPYLLLLSVVAIAIGFSINFLLANTVCLAAMLVKEMDGIRILYYNIASILSGEFIPIVFLPFLGKIAVELLPFRYTLSFPVEILLGKLNVYEVKMGFLYSLIWLILSYLTYKFAYSKAIKKYEAEGI